jgi:hypothetical protein
MVVVGLETAADAAAMELRLVATGRLTAQVLGDIQVMVLIQLQPLPVKLLQPVVVVDLLDIIQVPTEIQAAAGLEF